MAGDVRVSLVRDHQGADLAITYCAEKSKDRNDVLFLGGVAAPVCSTSFAQDRGPFEDSRAVGRTQLLHDTDFSGWQQWFKRVGVAMPALDQSLVFEDFNLLRAATLAGQGVSLCPVKLIADDLTSGRLVQISSGMVSEDSGYYVKATSSAQNRECNVFREWLMATASGA